MKQKNSLKMMSIALAMTTVMPMVAMATEGEEPVTEATADSASLEEVISSALDQISKIDMSGLSEADKTQLSNFLLVYKEQIEKATNADTVASILDAIDSKVAEVTDSSNLESARASAIEILKGINTESLGVTYQIEAENAINSAISKINSSNDISEINTIVNEATSKIAGIAQDEVDATAINLEKTRTTYIDKLSEISDENLSDDNKETLADLIKEAKEKINEAETSEDVANIYKEYYEKIDAVLVADAKEKVEAKNLATIKERAVTELNNAVSGLEYRTSEADQVKKLIDDYTEKINDADDIEEVQEVLTKGKNEILSVKTHKELEGETRKTTTSDSVSISKYDSTKDSSEGKKDATAEKIRTGDSNNLAGYLTLAAAATVGVVVGVVYKLKGKKKESSNEDKE